MMHHVNLFLALTLGPLAGFAGAVAFRWVMRHIRKPKPDTNLPAACETVAVNQCIDDVRSATARMKSRAGL